MEELFQNFAEHIGKMICPLMERIFKELANNYTAEEYANVERDIK